MQEVWSLLQHSRDCIVRTTTALQSAVSTVISRVRHHQSMGSILYSPLTSCNFPSESVKAAVLTACEVTVRMAVDLRLDFLQNVLRSF